MTWEELLKWVKNNYGKRVYIGLREDFFMLENLGFEDDGSIYYRNYETNEDEGIVENKTFDQMKLIIENMFDKE